MRKTSVRLATLLAVAAAVPLFAFTIGNQPQPACGGAQVCGSRVLADDDDDEQAQRQQQQAIDDMIQSEQQAEQQNEAAQQQMQLDEQLAST